MEERRKEGRLRAIISGGGTGGHIFPAISIANELRKRTGAEILFVGAEDRMEMEKVPAAGYKIEGLPVAGFDRKRPWRNIKVLWKLQKSIRKARKLVKEFGPDIVIGVGGYASGPTLKAAQKLGIPTLIQEQNSFAGVTNKLLAKQAEAICVAYDGMERFFPAGKIVKTGNPIRKDLLEGTLTAEKARTGFGLKPEKPTLLVVGGSLGALSINEAMERSIKGLVESGIQVIWQTGKYFGERAPQAAKGLSGVVTTKFINDMGAAYAAASLVVSRAGAGSISELELLGKPAVLVPSPNVAEDHQTRNAEALSSRGAAVLLPDTEVREKLLETVTGLIKDPERLKGMREAVLKLALPESAEKIVEIALETVKGKR